MDLFSEYEKNTLSPSLSVKRTLINKEFYSSITTLELITKGKAYFIIAELRSLKKKVKEELFLIMEKEGRTFLITNNKMTTQNNIAEYIVENYPELCLSKKTIINYLSQKVQKNPDMYKDIYNIHSGINLHLSILLAGNEVITAQRLADAVGCSLRTVKTYYPEFKAIINGHKAELRKKKLQPVIVD